MNKHTPGPWKLEVEDKFDDNWEKTGTQPTGWIEGIVEYEGCGSHKAEWKNEADLKLVLAAPEMYEMLKEISEMYDFDLSIKNQEILQEKIKNILSKAEGF